MKALISTLLLSLFALNAFADGIKTVQIDGADYTNIDSVYIGSNGRIMIFSSSGGVSSSADKLPKEFLKSWGIDVDSARSTESKKSAEQLERAITIGDFREIDGVVYDIRKAESGWVSFPKAKVIQVLDDGTILDAAPDSDSSFPVFVKHLGGRVGDTDTLTFTAKLVGSYSYINKLNDDRTIREYDFGRICTRDEIPTSILTGQKAFAAGEITSSPHRDILASLPESSDLKASGSGFFITDNGYLISNNHVVKNATKVRVTTSAGTVDARIVQVDSANDLALLKVTGKYSSLPIASSRTARLGGTVLTIGFPDVVLQGFSPKLAKGEIASLSGIEDDPRYFQISAPVQPGNSGGALVDDHGNVIGVVAAKLDASVALAATGALPENVNYAVKSSLLLSFLESVPDLSTGLKSPVTTEQKSDDIVSQAKDAAALILVY